MFLRISNQGTMNRMFLELIGFGTKRDKLGDDSVIGNKSSGAKLAAVAAMRLGLDLAIASSDANGRYVLTFETESVEADGIVTNRIVLAYRTLPHGLRATKENIVHERRPWHLTTDAFMDWDKPIGEDADASFKVVREYVCNAKDADDGWRISFGERVTFAPEGMTIVFMRFTDEVHHLLYGAPERYFKFLVKKPRYHEVKGHGRIYQKAENDVTRFFHLGVLIGCEKPTVSGSVFDYSLNDKDLVSEERTVKSSWAFKAGVGNMLAAITDIAMVKELFEAIVVHRVGGYEASALEEVRNVPETSARVWREVIEEHYGSAKVCLESSVPQIDGDAEQVYGYKVARGVPNGFASFMRRLGYVSSRKVIPDLPETLRVPFGALDDRSRADFMSAFRLCAKHFPERAKLPIAFFFIADENMRKRVLGYATGNGGMKEIWIACDSPSSLSGGSMDLFLTLVHEGRHIETQAGDYDRVFMACAEHDLLTVVLRAEGIAEFRDGWPVPPQADPSAIAPSFVPVDAEPSSTEKKVPPSPVGGYCDEAMDALFRSWDEGA